MNQTVEFGLCGIGMHFRSHMSRYFVGWQGRIPALLPWNSSFRFCSKGFVCPMVVWEISREVDYDMSVLYHQKLWSDMIENGKPRQFFEVNVGECRWTFGCLLQMYGTVRCLVMFFGGVLLGWTPNLRQEVHDLGQKLKASQDAWPGHAVLSRFVLLKQSQDMPRYWFMSSGIGEFKHIQTMFFLFFWWTTYAVPRVLWLMKSIIIQMLCIQCI